MRQILCLADDLTGAASLASGLGELGGRRTVGFEAPEPPWEGPVVVDLRVRDAAETVVRERVVAALRRARPARDAIVSLRIDSTGLSPLGPLLEAALGELGDAARAFVVPVHPSAGRRFIGGRLLAGDRALEWRADRAGVRGRPATVVPLEEVRSDAFGRAGAGELPVAEVLLFEGESEADLLRIAWLVLQTGGPVIVADPGPFTLSLQLAGRPPARVLAIMGSTSALSERQVAAAEARMGVAVVTLDVEEATGHPGVLGRVTAEVVGLLESGRSVCVITAGKERQRQATEASALLGATAAAAVEAGTVDALYMSGGHVAEAVCSALGVKALVGLGEIDVLASCGWLEGGIASGLPVALKGGQVGREGTMVRMLERLAQLGSGGPRALETQRGQRARNQSAIC